jgi:hypothetical protein
MQVSENSASSEMQQNELQAQNAQKQQREPGICSHTLQG